MMPRKVVHVITRLDWGGAAKNTLLTALGLDRSRFDPMVVTGLPEREDAQGGIGAMEDNLRQLEKAGVRSSVLSSLVRAIHPIKDVAALWRLFACFRRDRPTIVHTHTSKAGVLGRLAAWGAGVPVVIHTPHGHVFYGHFGRVISWLFVQIERWLAARTMLLIALTEAERDEHLAYGVGRPDRFAVVPSGIDLERFRGATAVAGRKPEGFDCPPDAIVVGSVGWLTPVKGHRVLLEAVALLKPRWPRLHLVIVGSGPLREEIMGLARERGIAESVHLLGTRMDVPECLGAMDIVVQPSLNEGMGRAVIEAMAAGRPVVASRVGGIPAIVQDRGTGLLVPSGDPAALASAIEELLRKPDWAMELGAAARASIGERFGAGAMVRAIEAVYERAIREAVISSRM